jgi:DNA-binding MarR family transcriptional regulator
MPDPPKQSQQAGAPQARQGEERTEAPRMEEISMPGRMLKDPRAVADALSALSFLRIASEKGTVAAANIESRDIRRNPYLFSIIYLRPESLELAYSVVPGASPRRRKIDVLRHLLNVLAMLQGAYEADSRHLYEFIQSALKDLTEFASSEYSEIFAKYDSLKATSEELRKKSTQLESTNSRISKELIEARSENDELTIRVKQLEAYTDDALMAKIQDWLDVHRNEINVTDFAKHYNVTESRVENVLNEMVIRGYLELRG